MISVGMNSPNHNSAINNVNWKALGGQEQLLGKVWEYSHDHFGDKYHWERLHSGGYKHQGCLSLLELASDIRQVQTCKDGANREKMNRT